MTSLMSSPKTTLLVTCGVSFSFFLYKFYASRSRRHLKSFKNIAPDDEKTKEKQKKTSQSKEDITRDRITRKKLPQEVDVIVIGSGIGSLYLAALLAKAGRRVVVLEQHYVAGGCTHCFEDKGWEFDTGVHYIGRVDKYGYLLDQVSEGEKIQWQKLGSDEDGYCYDSIKVGDSAQHNLRSGRECFVADLVAKFPEEEAAIQKYLDLVVACNKNAEIHFFAKLFPKWVEYLLEKTLGARFQTLASRTVSDVMDELFTNKSLKAILLGQYGDYGMAPENASFFIHAGIVAHYLDGAYYPIGGPQEISRALIPTIINAGGRVFVNAPVKSLQLENDRCTGVVLENGIQISAPIVVSGAGVYATQKIVENTNTSEVHLPAVLSNSRKCLLGGISHMYAFLAFDGDAKALNLPSYNLWVIPGEDITRDSAKYYENPFSEELDGKHLLFMGFPTAKDPRLSAKYPGKSTCVVVTEAKTEWFDEFKNSRTGKRPGGYQALKRRFEEKLLEGVYHHFPQLRGRLLYSEIASPLTNDYYLRRTASYGLTHQPFRYTAAGGLRPETDIKGLWLTGQDVATNGFAGAMTGGLLTAHGILGYGIFDLLVCNTNIVTDLAKSSN